MVELKMQWKPRNENVLIGKPTERIDGLEKASGIRQVLDRLHLRRNTLGPIVDLPVCPRQNQVPRHRSRPRASKESKRSMSFPVGRLGMEKTM